MMRSWRGDGSRRNLVLGSLHGGILISLSRGLQINEGFQAGHVFNESILAALLRDKVKCNEETKIKKKILLEILILPSIQEARDEILNLNNFNRD